MTSIERTAYQRFLSARELHVFYTPQTEEIAWASGQVRSDNHLLALMVQLKCFNRMGYFPWLDDVPEAVVAHIRRDPGLGEDVAAVYDSDRLGEAARRLRAVVGVIRSMVQQVSRSNVVPWLHGLVQIHHIGGRVAWQIGRVGMHAHPF